MPMGISLDVVLFSKLPVPGLFFFDKNFFLSIFALIIKILYNQDI